MNGLTCNKRETEQIRPSHFSQVNLHCFQINFERISFDHTVTIVVMQSSHYKEAKLTNCVSSGGF